MYPEHRKCNVCVDLSSIKPFGLGAGRVKTEDLLICDLQTNLYSNVTSRLGSGRSGVYRGYYLKGVGRTGLAANWCGQDYLHNSGHLPASAAVREFVVSCYLSALGLNSTIVPCKGVLLAPLASSLQAYGKTVHAGRLDKSLPKADRHLQSLTVKNADFMRISNFTWLLNHLSPQGMDEGRTSLATLVQLMARGLSRFGISPENSEAIEPTTAAELLASALDQTLSNFESWFEAGVYWGSFRNNLTIDGRFLDLETPIVSGGPFVGVIELEGVHPDLKLTCQALSGSEALLYMAQMSEFCYHSVRVLSSLPSTFEPLDPE